MSKLWFNFFFSRITALSKKLTAMDENISCDPLYLAKVRSLFLGSTRKLIWLVSLMASVCFQVGRERPRFDLDDYDSVPQKFNI